MSFTSVAISQKGRASTTSAAAEITMSMPRLTIVLKPCSGTSLTPGPSSSSSATPSGGTPPPPTRSSPRLLAELKLRILDAVHRRIDYCDPDVYPVAFGSALQAAGLWVDPDALFVTGEYPASAELDARQRVASYTEPALLIVDELGYLSLDQQSSNLPLSGPSFDQSSTSAPITSFCSRGRNATAVLCSS